LEGDELSYRVRKNVRNAIEETDDDDEQAGPSAVVYGPWRKVLITQEERDVVIRKVHSEGNVH
jgi:hypothetical protein